MNIHEETLKIARNLIEKDPSLTDWVISKFPELQESKDEKIRKYLINYVKHAGVGNSLFDSVNTRDDILLWLENQGNLMKALQISNARIGELIEENYYLKEQLEKQSEQDNNEDEAILHRFSFYSYKDEPNILYLAGLYVNDKYRNKGIGTKILEVADEVAKSLNCHAIRLKTKKDSNAERLYQTYGYNSLAIEGRDKIWLEKQCEQKSADEIEPKFNIDDIISDGISEVKIVSIDKKNKYYNITNGEIENDAHICNWIIYFKDQEKWKLVKSKDNKKHSQPKQELSKEEYVSY